MKNSCLSLFSVLTISHLEAPLNPGQSTRLEGTVGMGIRLGSLFSEVTRGQERTGFPRDERFLFVKKLEWEETQGNLAILWLPAGTSSSEICLINT